MTSSLLFLLATLATLATTLAAPPGIQVWFSGSGGCDTDDPTCLDPPSPGTSTISTLLFNSSSGSLLVKSEFTEFNQPAWITAIPNTAFLLATETSGSSIHSLSYNPKDYTLSHLSSSETGDAPVYISLDLTNQYIFSANYMGGSLSVTPINKYGMLGESVSYKHFGNGPDMDRQEASHVHGVVTQPSSISSTTSIVYAVDLGIDRIVWYEFDASLENPEIYLRNGTGGAFNDYPNYVQTQPGAGPRHIVFTGNYAHVICEMASHIETFEIDEQTGALLYPAVSIQSTLPSNVEEGFSKAAEILTNDDNTIVYVTNRGPAEGSNSIAVFYINPSTGVLTPKQFLSSQGLFPRGAALTENRMIVGGQDSDNIAVFEVMDDGTLNADNILFNLTNIISPVTFATLS
ncbi:hypothetical protein TL16_g10430 [Triparma laevis f. inornata]|uniref:6-phosphogluconolactonase n=1 Tax=Triparma laevis f. inornata TaxID=1714386 RepID=A0A9W7BDR4_9STRA|nr:hypothetical protein TL16_g10430 [Triparma laevis f. inornata]